MEMLADMLRAEPALQVGLAVAATPNPCDRYTLDEPIPAPFANTWYYATTVTNVLDVALRVQTFGAFVQAKRGWQALPSPLGRPLLGRDFASWYGADLLAPGQSVTDPKNNHGGDQPKHPPVRWVYIAATPDGRACCGWVDVSSVPMRRGWYQAKPLCCRDDGPCAS